MTTLQESTCQRQSGDVPEYVIHAKLKNNLLLSRILGKYSNVAEFCKAHRLSQTEVGNLINLKKPAIRASTGRFGAPEVGPVGMWNAAAVRVAEALQCVPEDLFSEEQRTVELASNEAWIEMSRQQALEAVNPIETIETRDLANKLLSSSSLTKKEAAILHMRYGMATGEEQTLEDVAKALGVTRERVRQMEAKALRKLRGSELVQELACPYRRTVPLFDPHVVGQLPHDGHSASVRSAEDAGLDRGNQQRASESEDVLRMAGMRWWKHRYGRWPVRLYKERGSLWSHYSEDGEKVTIDVTKRWAVERWIGDDKSRLQIALDIPGVAEMLDKPDALDR